MAEAQDSMLEIDHELFDTGFSGLDGAWFLFVFFGFPVVMLMTTSHKFVPDKG